MNVFLWVLQVFLALHTVMGAVWKFSNSEQAVPSLSAISHGGWLALSVIELVVSLALVVPALRKQWGMLVPLAAAFVVAEMLLFTVVHLASGATEHGQMIYWLVVAAVCGFLAWGRFKLRPISAG